MEGVGARRRAVETAISREARTFDLPRTADGRPVPIAQRFGRDEFTWEEMRERLPLEVAQHLAAVRNGEEVINPDICEMIAAAVYRWAAERGAEHFCRWASPRGIPIPEVHEAFLRPGRSGTLAPGFSGTQLLGSAQNRWDPRSSLFIRQAPNGAILCVPSTLPEGQGLRAPLRASTDALTTTLQQHASARPVGMLQASFFIIDEAYASLRPDLLRLGRSLVGRAPLTNQHIERIPPRALALLQELTTELIQLGVPVRGHSATTTPSQFSLLTSPVDAAQLCDHDQLVQEVLASVAPRHHLRPLTHPMPFQGYARQTRTVSWWLQTPDGQNLLASPSHLRERIFAAAGEVNAQCSDDGLVRLSCDANQPIADTLTRFQNTVSRHLQKTTPGAPARPRTSPVRARRGVHFQASMTTSASANTQESTLRLESAVLLELTQRVLLPTARAEPFFPDHILRDIEERSASLSRSPSSRSAFDALQRTFATAEEEIADERWPLPRTAEVLLQGV